MIEDFFAGMIKDRIMQEMGPYIVVGALAMIMWIGYNVTNTFDKAMNKGKGR